MMRLALWWWIDRWRKSTAFTDMTLAEQGAYRNLLDEAHLRGGALPNDERILAKACGDALKWKRVRRAVLARFEIHGDGLHNKTLDEVMAESTRRAIKQSRYRRKPGNADGNAAGNASGNGGGNAGGNGGGNNDGNTTGNRGGPPVPVPVPVPVLSRSMERETRAREAGPPEPSANGDDDLRDRAGAFVSRYGTLYATHRQGAIYHSKPAIDYQDAIALCMSWGDGRLDTLVTAFLTTDDRFCRTGSGSIAQFRSRASWCDAMLRKSGL